MDLRDLLLVLAWAAFELILLEVAASIVSSFTHKRPSTSVVGDRGLPARGYIPQCSKAGSTGVRIDLRNGSH